MSSPPVVGGRPIGVIEKRRRVAAVRKLPMACTDSFVFQVTGRGWRILLGGSVAKMEILEKTMSRPKRTFIIVLGLLCAGLANATPLTWYLQGVRFTDGGTAGGSFVYDATANLYSSINIVTTTGSVRTGATYLYVNPHAFISTASVLAAVTANSGDLTGTPWYASVFVSPLTNAGGTISIDTLHGGGEATCVTNCLGTTEPNRFFTAGSVTTAPEPSTIGLLFLGVMLIGPRRALRHSFC